MLCSTQLHVQVGYIIINTKIKFVNSKQTPSLIHTADLVDTESDGQSLLYSMFQQSLSRHHHLSRTEHVTVRFPTLYMAAAQEAG